MKVFNKIIEEHTNIHTCRKSYMINEYIEITVNQTENQVVMWAFNYKTDRFVNLGTKRFKKLIDEFKLISSDLYSKGDYYYITLNTLNNNTIVNSKPFELEIVELKQNVACLNDIITRLKESNKKLENDVDKYRADYLHYLNKYAELRDKDFKRTIEELDGIKKNSFMPNARGAGRKNKFDDTQVEEIKRLRVSGNTIKEIANRFECSVGLIHKLINETKEENK